MANAEKRGGRPLEFYKNVNKYTFVGASMVAGVSYFIAPPLFVPALTWAAIDGAQIVAINKYQNSGRGKAAVKEATYGKYHATQSAEMTSNKPISLERYRNKKQPLSKAA